MSNCLLGYLVLSVLACSEPAERLDGGEDGYADLDRSVADVSADAKVDSFFDQHIARDREVLRDASDDLGVPDHAWNCSPPPSAGVSGEGLCEIDVILHEAKVVYPEAGSVSEHSGRHRAAALELSACGSRFLGRCTVLYPGHFVWSGQGQKTQFPVYFSEGFFSTAHPYNGGPGDDQSSPTTSAFIGGPPDVYEIWLEVVAFHVFAEEGGTPEEDAAPPVRRRVGPILFELAPSPDAGVP